eukprot:2306497-Rhodomonas_salina.1
MQELRLRLGQESRCPRPARTAPRGRVTQWSEIMIMMALPSTVTQRASDSARDPPAATLRAATVADAGAASQVIMMCQW